MSKSIYVGVMTGTSCDAIDVSFISISKKVNLEFFHSIKIPKKTQTEIKNLIASNETSLSSLGKINKDIGEMYSRAIEKSILLSGLQKKDIKGIALSGQTVWHEINKGKGFSMQLGDPNIVAADLNIPVIDNLRGMHIATGGHGAPLVPEFHHDIFYKKNKKVLIVNIGGISNFTYIKNKTEFFGSDIGPGNALMDAYCQKNLDRPFDKNGAVASKGIVLEKELKRLISLKFFSDPFPKSTGKELFNYELIGKSLLSESPKDILATLTELTALSIQVAVQENKFLPNDIVICGGGVKNKFLLERISKLLDVNVTTSEDEGFNSQAIESMAFAWFGFRRLNNIQSMVQISNKIVKKALLGSLTSSK